jgi:hypothetical protein
MSVEHRDAVLHLHAVVQELALDRRVLGAWRRDDGDVVDWFERFQLRREAGHVGGPGDGQDIAGSAAVVEEPEYGQRQHAVGGGVDGRRIGIAAGSEERRELPPVREQLGRLAEISGGNAIDDADEHGRARANARNRPRKRWDLLDVNAGSGVTSGHRLLLLFPARESRSGHGNWTS